MSAPIDFSNIVKVFAVVVLRNDGTRIYSKYYSNTFPKKFLQTTEGSLEDVENQKAFELRMQDKSKKLTNSKSMNSTQTEIFTLEQYNIVFKILNDVQIFVIGDTRENLIFLSQVLQSLQEALNHFTKDQINKTTLVENFEYVILLIDELIDEGLIVTLEVETLIARASMKDCEKIQVEKPSESGFSSVFDQAKKSITKTWHF